MDRTLSRWSALFLSVLALHLFCIFTVLGAHALDAGPVASVVEPVASFVEPAAPPAEPAPVYFKSGVKYDPASHQWLDRHSGKPVAIGPPAFMERYGAALMTGNCNAGIRLIADNTNTGAPVIAANSTTGGSQNTAGISSSTWKKFLIFSLLGLGTATAITLPIALGIHHHHTNFSDPKANQLAIYYYFHNQTLPTQHFVLPPPHFDHGGPSGPKGPSGPAGPGGPGGPQGPDGPGGS